jgi:hypothetical protein
MSLFALMYKNVLFLVPPSLPILRLPLYVIALTYSPRFTQVLCSLSPISHCWPVSSLVIRLTGPIWTSLLLPLTLLHPIIPPSATRFATYFPIYWICSLRDAHRNFFFVSEIGASNVKIDIPVRPSFQFCDSPMNMSIIILLPPFACACLRISRANVTVRNLLSLAPGKIPRRPRHDHEGQTRRFILAPQVRVRNLTARMGLLNRLTLAKMWLEFSVCFWSCSLHLRSLCQLWLWLESGDNVVVRPFLFFHSFKEWSYWVG